MTSTRPLRHTALALFLGLVGGCDSPFGGSTTGPVSSHGGTLLELPDRSGFVELMVEKADPQAQGRRAQGRVVAYFFNKEGNAALNPAPTDVSFVDEAGKRYPMSTSSLEPSGARFESVPVLIALGEPTGTIEAKVGTETVRVQNRPR